jgi:hypothetical protein
VPWGWVGVALVLAVAAGAVAFGVASGLPADTSVTLGWRSLQWSLSKAGVWAAGVVVSIVVFAGLWLVFAVVGGVWRGLGFVTALIFPILGLPEVGVAMTRGLQAALAFIVAAALVSTAFGNMVAIFCLTVGLLALGAAICVRQVFLALPAGGLGVSSRSSAIGGGQMEWRISPALLFSFLALALAGGAVTLGASALRPASPASEPAHPHTGGGAKGAGDGASGESSSAGEKGEPKPKTPPASPLGN